MESKIAGSNIHTSNHSDHLWHDHEDEEDSEPPLPSQDTLALIAAILGRNAEDPAVALESALKLWKTAGEKLLAERCNASCYTHPTITLTPDQLPDAFPVTFRVFLKLIVRARDLATATGRFREFLRQRENPFAEERLPREEEVDSEMAELRAKKLDEYSYRLHACSYLSWWQWADKEKKSRAGKIGQKIKRSKKAGTKKPLTENQSQKFGLRSKKR